VAGDCGEDARPGVEPARLKACTGSGEHGPKLFALLRSEAFVTPEAWHGEIFRRIPHLPGVDDMRPFRAKEVELGAQTRVHSSLLQRAGNLVILRDVGAPSRRKFEQLRRNAGERRHADARDDARLGSGEKAHLAGQSRGEWIRECREQHTRVRRGLGKSDRPVERDYGLAGPGGTGDARRAGEVLLYGLALGGMEVDHPLLPGRVESLGQFFDALDGAETPKRIRMVVWVWSRQRKRM
jgi:hypothetical protein